MGRERATFGDEHCAANAVCGTASRLIKRKDQERGSRPLLACRRIHTRAR